MTLLLLSLCSSFILCCCDEHHNREKGFVLAYILHSAITGCQDKHSRQGPEGKDRSSQKNTAYWLALHLLAQLLFLYNPGHLPRDGTAYSMLKPINLQLTNSPQIFQQYNLMQEIPQLRQFILSLTLVWVKVTKSCQHKTQKNSLLVFKTITRFQPPDKCLLPFFSSLTSI